MPDLTVDVLGLYPPRAFIVTYWTPSRTTTFAFGFSIDHSFFGNMINTLTRPRIPTKIHGRNFFIY